MALEQKRSKGERVGGIPYGYASGKNIRSTDGKTIQSALLTENPAEMAVAREIRTLRASDSELVNIAARLNERGLNTRRATEWRFQYVATILNQPAVVLAAR